MAVSIRFEHVTKCFGDNRVVDDIDLTIEPGELFFLLGPSGCGKTTLLRCIAGFYIPESGKIFIGNKDVTQLAPEDRDTGMVFQSYALWPHMTVKENVAFGLELRKVPKAEMQQRVAEALAAVKMTDRADYKPNQLSGGQQQRVALARALVVRPKCLLLDEPLSNLDAKLRLEMRGEIRRICKQFSLTAVYVTHDQKEALSIADRIAVLDKGKIQQCGAPREVYKFPTSRFVAHFIGETNFVEGTVEKVSDREITVATPVGPIGSTVMSAHPPAVGQKVTLSIRPEVIHIGYEPPPDAGNVFDAAIHDTIYLGEMAQHEVNIITASSGHAGDLKLNVFDMNPKIVAIDNDIQMAKIWVRKNNVVVLRD
ncbi:MAG TPA: ABC transporter ATP-binding protein [Kiritimatiellia bacterium]|nr:ABC transporter ATP-binding protein [Kiritimatiellia bacterium]HMP00476.1 ABC transporter ATP-binding protein [Kiritimatiellia bacterium]HMP97342.1 ABC transporter ATP-binding protein [Kiritimatiellia bacterium]